MLYGQLPEFPYGYQMSGQSPAGVGVPWIGEQPMAADQWDWEWYDDWDNDNPGRGFRPIRRRRLRPRRVGIPFGKLPFGKMPFGQIPFGKIPSGKIPSGKIPSGKIPLGKAPFGQIPFGKHFGKF